MSEFISYEQHPIAADLQFVADALTLGAGNEIPYWGLLQGIEVEYLDANMTKFGTSYLKMQIGTSRLVEYQFEPPINIANPLTVIEEDNGEITIKTVKARLLVTLQKPPLIKIGVRDGQPITANSVQIDVIDSGAILSVNESLNMPPVLGEYDGDVYRFIGRKTYEELRLGYVLQFAREFAA